MTSENIVPHQNRLLVNAIDEQARRSPQSIFLRYADRNWETDGYKSITRKQVADGINRAAYWLDQQLNDMDDEDAHTVTYDGPNDPRYAFIGTGAIKTGRRVLIANTRMAEDAILTLLDDTKCNIWITTEEQRSAAKNLLVDWPSLRIFIIPALEYFLEEKATTPYPYSKTSAEVENDVAFITHTSGTTGRPKAIYHTNRFISTHDSWSWLNDKHKPRQITYEKLRRSCSLMTSPPQWLSWWSIYFASSFYEDVQLAILPADATVPVNAQTVIKVLEQSPEIKGLSTVPQVIEAMSETEHGLRALGSLDWVTFGGAALHQKVGDEVRKLTNIFSSVGSTEGGSQVSFECSDPAAWNSFEFVPESGARFERVSDDVYELWFDRTPESEIVQGMLDMMEPGVNTISSNELYSPRQYADGSTRWVFYGRADSMTKLNHDIFHAADFEFVMRKHPLVKDVLVGGERRAVPFMIVQLVDQEEKPGDEKAKIIDNLFDYMVANTDATEAKGTCIPKEMIMLTDSKRPFKFTLKGTILRKAMEDLYQDQIEASYRAWEEVS